ncbi:ABC transporter permease [Pseudoalteromonas sp. SWXJZ94C]|uniref:ABC transporter permease n=1 Tax=Pseudoalteromonas sp. SWXJZ94C TaxID=2792065 RepID=UPI0018CF37AF|nr:ABC transporter permease [Pseudoalteromonas sp. SWXJZ94C]MBH0057542.1 ABC transporter permease [Pseudoalteromonas sp. SWXJZ94C]
MLIHTVKKEARLIINDLHSLAVLLLMPIVFMVIMTMASSQSQKNIQANLTLSVIGQENSAHSNILIALLIAQGFTIDKNNSDNRLTVEPGVDKQILMRQGNNQLRLDISDELAPQTRLLMTEKVKASLSQLKLYLYMLDTGDLSQDLSLAEQINQVVASSDVSYLLKKPLAKALHNPALNSIPAWWVFGIYFIVLPISLTFINERNNGTLVRLKTYPISMARYFYNKACAYVIVSLIQGCLLAIIGCIAIPYFLNLPVLPLYGLLLSIFTFITVSFTAIAFALLLASMVSSYEQAIVVGGGVNIILAALSGFMVPLEIMPDNLAALANGSPMFWSAQLLRQLMSKSVDHIFWQYTASLWGFSLLCFVAALYIFNKKMRNLTWN